MLLFCAWIFDQFWVYFPVRGELPTGGAMPKKKIKALQRRFNQMKARDEKSIISANSFSYGSCITPSDSVLNTLIVIIINLMFHFALQPTTTTITRQSFKGDGKVLNTGNRCRKLFFENKFKFWFFMVFSLCFVVVHELSYIKKYFAHNHGYFRTEIFSFLP